MTTHKSTELVVFFADFAGSTALYEQLGDRLAHQCVSGVLDKVAELIKEHKGIVVEIVGDEVMACFKAPLHALDCACNVQKLFDVAPLFHGFKTQVRIGFHYGPVGLDDGQPYGDTVNVAARLSSLARGGQTVLSASSMIDFPNEKQALCRPFAHVNVKGKSSPLDVMEVVWDLSDATSFVVQPIAVDVEPIEIKLHYNGETVLVTAKNTPFGLGRGHHCDLTVEVDTASRSHASIESRYGELVLVDHSTNGTYLATNQNTQKDIQNTLYLHHREWIMIGKGQISLGKPISKDTPQCIAFELL